MGRDLFLVDRQTECSELDSCLHFPTVSGKSREKCTVSQSVSQSSLVHTHTHRADKTWASPRCVSSGGREDGMAEEGSTDSRASAGTATRPHSIVELPLALSLLLPLGPGQRGGAAGGGGPGVPPLTGLRAVCSLPLRTADRRAE